ncbi:MAG: autotransporter outer membrane beta-barrel domain-containing protein [bacterium]|nr:autotransporter outer membrane beta-barrel domain-containing protein [bacterium]
MNNKIIFFLTVLLFSMGTALSGPASAQTFTWDTDVAQKGVKGIANVAASIVSDSFTPMTHYGESDLTISLVPAWFNIKKAYDDPEVNGNDLTGFALGGGAGYALNDRWLLYGILSYMSISGGLSGNLYGDTVPAVETDMSYNIFSLAAGTGVDLISDNSRWSIPLYLGLVFMRYGVEMTFPQYQYATGPDAYVDVSVEDSSFLMGFSAGIAVSCKLFDLFKLTPYLLFMRSFNQPELTGTITSSGGVLPLPVTAEQSITIDYVNACMFGLNISGAITSAFSVSVSVGGLLSSSTSFYNKTFLNGLKMTSIVVALTYTSPGTPVEEGR